MVFEAIYTANVIGAPARNGKGRAYRGGQKIKPAGGEMAVKLSAEGGLFRAPVWRMFNVGGMTRRVEPSWRGRLNLEKERERHKAVLKLEGKLFVLLTTRKIREALSTAPKARTEEQKALAENVARMKDDARYLEFTTSRRGRGPYLRRILKGISAGEMKPEALETAAKTLHKSMWYRRAYLDSIRKLQERKAIAA
ncbi:hypothetical protein COU36_05110 [Candidatus Micrarchaeota archaeon CG10_big_fil_rev_8_21_14_0_10_59_7]|nr:MAG: hypothetical protein COU36_05110 [Candidatus Micrarchaeota archaeon CG10_big_fil_rev_8_21_14_0_10_59_7]